MQPPKPLLVIAALLACPAAQAAVPLLRDPGQPGPMGPATLVQASPAPAEDEPRRAAPILPGGSPLVPPQRMTPAALRSVQSRLLELGFYTGPPDGLWSPSTQAGLYRFQQLRGLVPTGQVTPATLRAMGL